mmetsp:Transcript_32159/g.31477  ORF Transcript_32159/g.31477 Transcript_32159/m.31477 type:complete len:103 (-) Transcript_32159:74-382(-)
METLDIMKYFLSNLPVQKDSQGKFEENMALLLQSGFTFTHNFYLDYSNKNEMAPAVFNMLQLNYNNYLDVNDDKLIQLLTTQKAKEHIASEMFQGIISNDMR